MFVAGVTQQMLATRAQLSVRTVESACSGVASRKTLDRISGVLRVPVAALAPVLVDEVASPLLPPPPPPSSAQAATP